MQRVAGADLIDPVPLPPARVTFSALTGLRFVAAFLVFLHHFAVPGASGALLRFMNSGYCGVTFFFVLSGFVLCHRYLAHFTAQPVRALAPYWVARFAKVYPVYAFVLLAVWLGTQRRVDLAPYLILAYPWIGDPQQSLPGMAPAWSLGVEAVLYLAFPLLVLCLHRAGVFAHASRLFVAAVLVAAIMLGVAAWFSLRSSAGPNGVDASAHYWLYAHPIPRLGDFALGVLAAGFWMRYRDIPRATTLWALLSAAMLGVIVLLMSSERTIYSAYSWDVAYALPGVVLIVALAMAPRTPIARLLGSSTFIVLGELSYCFYLLHVPIGALRPQDTGVLAIDLASYAGVLAIVIAASYGMYRLWERPAQRWIKQTYRALVARRARAIEA